MRKLLKQALALTTSVAMCLSMASPVLTVYAEDATVPTTDSYVDAGDLAEISPSQIQPGDLRVVYASGGTQGHVQMYVGGNAWIECAAGYGVGLNLSNGFMTSRPCHYFSYVGF